MFSNIGMPEILVILVVVLLLFGAKRLPEIGSSMGKGIREFKKSLTDVDKAITEPAPRDRLGAGDRDAYRERDTPRPEEDRPEPKRLI